MDRKIKPHARRKEKATNKGRLKERDNEINTKETSAEKKVK